MRLAYADPPYLGCCAKYGHEHNAGGSMPWDGYCWDDLDTHRRLLAYLDENYAGWAYSMTSSSWQQFDGRTVGEMHGNLAAAISALAGIVRTLLPPAEGVTADV